MGADAGTLAAFACSPRVFVSYTAPERLASLLSRAFTDTVPFYVLLPVFKLVLMVPWAT